MTGVQYRVADWLRYAMRVGITLALMLLVFAAVDIDDVSMNLDNARWPWIGLSAMLVGVIIMLESLQFAEITRSFGHVLGTAQALRISLVGRFFALFTPAMLGNDIYRAVALNNLGTGGRDAINMSVLSRLISLLSLAPVLLSGYPIIVSYTWPSTLFWVASFTILATVVLVILLMLPVSGRFFAQSRWKMVRDISGGADWLRYLSLGAPGRYRLWFCAILQHFVRVFAVMAMAKAFGISAGFMAFLAFVPVSLLISMIPVSVGSWGVREVALVVSLGTAGVEPGAALLTSISFGLQGTVFALLGGLIWMSGLGKIQRQTGSEDA